MPASAATTWRTGWTARPKASPRWAARAPTGSARRRSPRRGHVFQNLGDGTYIHSGSLAIRAARAAGVNMTYKILYNDAVAMTGGQSLDGGITVPHDAAAGAGRGRREGRRRHRRAGQISARAFIPHGVPVYHRRDLQKVQQELRDDARRVGAALRPDLRRREAPAPQARHCSPIPTSACSSTPAVCEGCGDCGVKSNCVAVQPLETELGTKRAIDQSACNKDFSCLNGFCPSFVTVHGAKVKKAGSRVSARRGVAEHAGQPARAEAARRSTSPTPCW